MVKVKLTIGAMLLLGAALPGLAQSCSTTVSVCSACHGGYCGTSSVALGGPYFDPFTFSISSLTSQSCQSGWPDAPACQFT